jgi:hypothetical protein
MPCYFREHLGLPALVKPLKLSLLYAITIFVRNDRSQDCIRTIDVHDATACNWLSVPSMFQDMASPTILATLLLVSHRMGPRYPNPNDAKAAAVKFDTHRG